MALTEPPAVAYERPGRSAERGGHTNIIDLQAACAGHTMAAPKRNIGQEILDGLRQLKHGEHGRVTTVPSVASIREGTGLSQPRFAELLGVSVRTLQEWEQGRRAPSGAARTLLLITAKNPRALFDVA